MATTSLARNSTKRWIMDEEVTQCPLCKSKLEGHFLDITVSGRTHCRYCGGVFCTNCCNQELYMPEDEVVRPPPSAKFKNIIFDPTLKQKACRPCIKILLPLQKAIKASRGRSGGRPSGFGSRKNLGPMYSITIIRAKGLRGARGSSSVKDPVCLLTMGTTSSITQATQSGVDPVWDQSFDVPVKGEHGNTLKLTCYEEELGGKRLIGEGFTKVVETESKGMWVPITDERQTVTGEVLVRCTFNGARASNPAAPASGSRGVALSRSYAAGADDVPEHRTPLLRWLQEKAWLVYVVLLLISVLYRFAHSIGFSGDPIVLKPGTPNGNNVSKRSDTHYITLLKNGNLVLREGKPGDPIQKEPLWESGRPYAKKDCNRCVFMLDETGQYLIVKDGRKVLVSLNVHEDEILSRAIKAR
ncbi:unnamed protein product [Ascophyllum nodosum]